MKKALRAVLKAVLIILIIFVLGFAVFATWLTVTEFNPAPIETLEVNGSAANDNKGRTIKVMTWNIGYGALGDNADFFMDGGKHVYTASKKRVQTNLYGITKTIREVKPDAVFMQEADIDSSRSHHVNEQNFIESNTRGYCYTYARNYKVAYIPYPIPPLGKMDAGILTLSRLQIDNPTRVSLPCPFKWPVRLGNLKRCISINKASVNGGTDNLSLVNLHLEAYDNGEGKAAQTAFLKQKLDEEYSSGNYVIAGGDFNQSFSTADTSMYPTLSDRWHCGELDCSAFSDHWQFAMDTSTPSCRSLDQPYSTAKDKSAQKFQYYMIDGFIVSDNLTIKKIETLDLGFKNSDHNPVVITLKIK